MEYRILGPLEVSREEREVELGGRKQRALLALLLLHANEIVHADRLIDELWAGEPPESAAKSLQVYVSRLRKQLGDRAVLTRAGGYLLEVSEGELDLDRFRAAFERGRRELAAGATETAAETLAAALALWRGPALADFRYDPFAQTEISRLEELRLAAVEERIEAELGLGRDADLVGELEALVDTNPLRERLRGQLMLALYRSGRQAEALEAYASARRVLTDELGLEPSRALQELERRILQHDASLEAVAVRAEGSGPPRRQRRAAAFVGRSRELDELEVALRDALDGRGRVVLLAGEPGIGKSRLADEIGERARRAGAAVVWGRSWEAGGAPAYWPWVQALRACIGAADPETIRKHLGRTASELAHLLPELRESIPGLPEAPALDSDTARFRLFDATVTFLRNIARARPHVVVLDDVHAADEPSLLLLRYVAREIADARVLLLVAYRDVDPTMSPALSETVEQLAREPGAGRLELVGLPETMVAEFIRQTAGVAPRDELVATIFGETDGNPLFVGEIVRMLASEGRLDTDAAGIPLTLPRSVRETIGRRVNRLPPESARILAFASVLGREFDLETLERVGGVSRNELLELLEEPLAARIVAGLPDAVGRLRFAHALIRDAIYEELTPVRRARLHREAGEALEAQYDHDLEPHLAELAHHFYAAAQLGSASEAVAYARRAGARAVDLLAFEEATRLFELGLNALELGRPVDETLRCELLLATGDAQARAGDEASAQESFRAAADIARRLGLAEPLARAALGSGGLYVFGRAGGNPHLVPLLREALSALGDRDDAIRAKVLARLATALRDEHSLEPRTTLSGEALEIARRVDDPPTLAWALAARHAASWSPANLEERLALSTELIEVAASHGDVERQVEGYRHRFIDAFEGADIAAALRDHDSAARLAAELRQPVHLWTQTLSSAMVALFDGRYDDAERDSADARFIGSSAQRFDAEFCYRVQLCALRREQGRLAELAAMLRQSVSEFPGRAIFVCYEAVLATEQGDDDRARALLRPLARDGLAAVSSDVEWLVNATLLAEVAARVGDVDAARSLYDALLPYEGRMAVTFTEVCTGAVSRYLGLLAASVHDVDRAIEHFDRALDLTIRAGSRPWTAHTACDYAAVLIRQPGTGDQARANELVELAAAISRELGMAALAERLAALP